LAALSILSEFLGIHYLVATFIAVEIAIIHNFLWHERWTWKDRQATGTIRRLTRFNLTTGLVSLVGNLALMPLLVQVFRLGVLPANVIAIVFCSLANFLLADRVVFRMPQAPGSAGILPACAASTSDLVNGPSRQDACAPREIS
jgi:putative flippase GtrA